MTEILTQVRSVSTAQLRQIQQFGADTAILLSAMPALQALAVRVELVCLVEVFQKSSRQVALQTDETISPELTRIAEGLAQILRITPREEHSAMWACFCGVVREHLEVYEFVADWACALREVE